MLGTLAKEMNGEMSEGEKNNTVVSPLQSHPFPLKKKKIV